jgi:hypothetical protein
MRLAKARFGGITVNMCKYAFFNLGKFAIELSLSQFNSHPKLELGPKTLYFIPRSLSSIQASFKTSFSS